MTTHELAKELIQGRNIPMQTLVSILTQRLRDVDHLLIAGPDCGGWHYLTNAESRKQALRDERAELEKLLTNRAMPD